MKNKYWIITLIGIFFGYIVFAICLLIYGMKSIETSEPQDNLEEVSAKTDQRPEDFLGSLEKSPRIAEFEAASGIGTSAKISNNLEQASLEQTNLGQTNLGPTSLGPINSVIHLSMSSLEQGHQLDQREER